MFTKKLKQEGLRKTAAVFTAISFMLSIFTSGGFAAPSQMPMRAQSAKIAPALPADYIVPFNIGRVTDAVNYKSDKVIVQIQDLHSHEETQRNIAGIISFLDSKYKIGNIYVEGAVGDIDTSWLADIEDEAVKTSVVDSLLAKGILTGAEYYSAVSGKTKVLKGMEDKDAYLENFRRLIRINSSKDEIKAAFPEIKEMIAFLSEKYYSKENKKIEEAVRKYREGKISFERYFSYIVKKARDKNVYFGFYPALIAFSNIIKVQSRLNKKKINAQMTAFMDELKEKVSFSEYKEIVSNFGKPETEAVFYFKLAGAYEKYGYNGKYGELAEFLKFINLNQHINPLDLVREEKELLREVREKYSVSGVERDLLFISDFLGLMESFLNNKITAAEYKYFERELPRFKTLWTQYTLVSGLPSLDGYYSLFEGFYSLNLARNNIFVENVTESKGGKNSGELASFDKNSINGVSAMISAAKELDIVVAGGFHTQDISRILQSSKQSYIVVTPNVTRDASAADRLFNEDIIRISKFIPANAYQKAIASARLNFIDDADKLQILNAVVGTYISKEVLDAALSALDEQTRDAAAADPRLLADIVKNEIIANIAGQLEQKGISDFNVSGIEIAENGYKVTAGSRETGQKTFNVDEEGASDSGQIQPFSVPTANNIVRTVRLASLLMSVAAAGMFFVAAPVIIPVSLAAASLIFGAFGISVKKSSAAVSEAQRQAKSSEPLAEAQAAQLKENIKNAIRNYVGEEKYDRLGVEIYDTAGSDDIAHVSTSRTATGKTIVLEIDLLAFSKLLDNDKTQAERILTHEARHILGHGEIDAYLANLLPKPLVKFYNAGKNQAYAEFYSSLNAMKALQETNAGFETRRKTARNLVDAAVGLMAFMKNATLSHSERRKILKLISEAVNVLKAGNINELAGAETVENEVTGSSSVEPASSGLAEGYNLLVSAVRTPFVKVSDNAGVDRITDEALEAAGIEKGSINESFFKNLIKKLLEKRSGARQAESLTMGFEDSEEAANRSKANFFGSAAAQWVREKMGAVSLKSIISDKRNAAAAERVNFVSYPLNGGIGSSLERKAYVAAVRKYLSELDAARKAQDAAKIADLKARMKSGEYLSGVSENEIKNAQLGAKASDLYFEVNGELKSVSELKMERMLIERDLGIYADVTMKMLVSSETRESVEELFNRESMKYAGRTYKELFKGIEMLEQAAYPVVCEKNGEIAFVMSDVAPGGHGYWGYYLLKALLSRTDAPTGAATIGVVSNEDGLNNKIPAELAGFMAREKVAVVMLSTTATDLDKKGGKIGVIKRNGKYVTGMMEAAQAESAGQTKEFQELGLTIGERGEQFFNTNTVLFNETLLAEMLVKLVDIIGIEEFEKVIMPDLIENKDKKTGNIKLEGAIGSVMLNLNAFFETTDNEEVKALKRKYVGDGQLVRIVNAEEELRSSVFTPVKKAIDIWFQKSSGYYGLNEDRMELEENTKNPIPAFNLEGKQYEDIRYLEQNWKNTDAADIKSLSIRGEGVSFGGVKLKGEVNIVNESGEDFAINREMLAETGLISEDDDSTLFRLPVEDGKIVLEDVEIIKNKKGEVIIRSMKPTKAVNIDDSDGVEEITDAALSARGIKGENDKKFFKNLVKKFIARRTGAERAESLTMGFENSEEAADKSEANFFGSGVSRWVREKMGAVSLKNIMSDKENKLAAKNVLLESYPLNGGIGSSLERKAYVAAVRKYLSELDAARKAQDAAKIADLKARMKSGEYLSGVSENEIKNAQLGAKASDLYFEVNGELKSVSELKMERMLIERDLGIYADVTMKMLVSSETVESVEELFNRESMKYAGRTYKDMFKNIEMLEQAAYPVVEIDRESGRIRFITSQVAPGGHGYWGYFLLKYLMERSDIKAGAATIGVVSNEDGLNNKIPAELAGFMAKEKIGIVMLSTTATDLDKKGGKIGVIKRNGKFVTGMMEAAQAESAGQTKEFQELGLTVGERGEQFFNTNTVLYNISVLAPMLQELIGIIGEEEFEKVIMPDLIENKDKKTGNIKLEGAIGSVMLNLNAFFETTDNEKVKALKRKYVGDGQLVRIVNAEEELRSSVFTPVKKAIDIWFQEESGYYKFNPDTYELEEAAENSVPAFTLEGKDYEDIKYLKKNWTNVDAKDIKSLTVKGEGVKFKNAVLAGDVKVINESGADIVISEESLGPEFALDADGRIIIQDMKIVVGEDGRVKVADSAETAAGKSFLRRIADALLKFLAGIVNRDTFVFKEAPGMLGRTYTIVLSDFGSDSINAVSKRAAEIARLGMNVNVIVPMNDNITDFTALGLISGEETGLRNLFTRKDKIENGREVNYYYYSRKTAAEFSSIKGDDKTDWANETLKWLRSRAVSEDDFGVIEVDLSSELSFEQVNALFPEAYIAASARQNEDLKLAESKGFIQTVRPGMEKNAVIEAGERFRLLKHGSDMRTSPLFSTVIDVDGTDITDAALADALLDMDLDTAVLKVNAAVLTQDTVNAIKKFMLSAQEKGLKTVIEFKAENEREALNLLTDMGSLLSQLRVNSRGVDGVRLDFNSLTGREMENVLTQSNLKSLRLAVNRENADGVIGIKAEDAGRSIEVNNALLMHLSALNIRNVITVETKADIADAGQAWLDFSTRGKVYNKQTSDALQIAGNIESALEAQAAVLGLDWEIISAMKNTAEGVNIAGMIKNIVRKKLSFFKATPAGRYDAGRKLALSKSDIGFKAGQEVSLYRLLNDMRNAEKADAVLVSKLFEIFPNAKTKQLGEAAASSDADKISLVFEEAKGYLQGILERSQSDIYIRATEFKVRTDADIYRAALVEARLYTVINNADIDEVQEVPYSSQLRDNKAYTDEKDAAVNAELARARELVGSVLARSESESIVALQPEVREAVNILTSLTEGKTLSSSANKAMAVADLLAMLALYADKVEKTAIEKGRDNLASMQEGVRAMLSAA